MIESKHMEKFKRLGDNPAGLEITGDFLIVEEVDPKAQEVVTASGLVVAGSSKNHDGFDQNRPTLVHVLMVGAGYVDEEGNSVPLEVQVGDILMVGGHSVKWLSSFAGIPSTNGSRIGITRESERQLRFIGGLESYNSIQSKLAGK